MKILGLVFGIIWVGATVISAEPNAKAERYLEALRKRPDSETLFDRFFDTWLDSGTIGELETFLKKSAEDGSATNELIAATFYLRQGNDEAAADWLEKISGEDSSSTEIRTSALTELGQISGRSLEFETALGYLKKAAEVLGELEERDVEREDELAKLRGQILVRSGQAEAGLAAWKEILKKRPEDEILQENVIELLADEGLYDEAIELQEGLIENSKDAYQTVLRRIQLGRLFRRADQQEKSVEAWRAALPATGHDTWIERELIALIDSAFRRKDDLKGLRAEVEKMIEDEPKRLSLKVAYADLLTQLRSDKKALEVWESILKLTPGDRELQLQFVRTLAMLDRPGEGAERMKSLIELNPADAELVFELAQLQELSGDVEGAGDSLEKFLEKSDKTEYSYLRVARQLQRYLLVERAEGVFEKLNTAFPDSAGAKESYATFLYETERKGRAIGIWESLGKSGDRSQLLRSSRQLAQRFESESAFELLKSRFAEFENDAGFLAELCQLSLPLDKAAEAFPWAQKRVNLARSTDELKPAIELAATVAARTGDALGLIENLANEKNQTIVSQCLLAELRSKNGDVDRAVLDLEKAVLAAEGKEILFPLVTLSGLQRREEQWAESAKTMERVIASPGGRRSSHIQELVELFEKASDSTASLKWAREWKKIAPGSSLPWTREAAMLNRQGLISESLEVLQDAARRFEKAPDVQVQLAAAYTSAGFPLEAERVLWRLYDDAADDWARRGWIDELVHTAQANGRVEAVLAKFQERQKNNSQAMGPLLALAEFYQLINRFDEYRETLLAAGRIEPENVDLVLRIVSLDEQAGRFDAAIQALEKIKSKDTSPRTVERLAKIHLSLGNIDQALQLMEELPSGKKASAAQLMSMGQVIATIGEWETLANFLTPKLADHPDDHSIRYLRAIALLENGNKEAAKEAFLELLNFEVPAVLPATPVVSFPLINYGGIVATGYPNSVTELSTWIGSTAGARSYRSITGEAGAIYSLIAKTNQGSNPVPIPIPTTQVMLQSYAVGHLTFLAEEDDDLSEALVDAGISLMRLDLLRLTETLKELSKSGVNVWQVKADDERLLPYLKAIRELMDRYPKNAELHGYWVMNLMMHYPDEALAIRALDLIQENFGVDMAVTAAFQATQGKAANYYWMNQNQKAIDPPSAILLERALEMTSGLEVVSDALVTQVAAFMIREISARKTSKEPRVSDEIWSALHDVLARWEMTAADKKMPWGNVNAFQSVMRVLANDDKTEAWVARLESEIARYEKIDLKDPSIIPPAANSTMLTNGGLIFGGSHFGGIRNQTLPEPTKIPTRMPRFSPAVLGLLRKEADPNQNYYRRGWVNYPNPTANLRATPFDLKDRLSDFSDRPLLHALMAHSFDDEESLDAGVEKLRQIAAEDEKKLTSAEALFLAHQENHAKKVREAIAFFERVRYEPIDSQTAKTIDMAIVSIVQKQPEEAALRASGLKAALRLRSSKVIDPNQEWPAVATVLKAWGHEDKAKTPSRIRVAANVSNPYQIQRSQFRPATLQLASLKAIQSRLKRLLDDQQDEAAIRVASKLLPLASGQILNLSGEKRKQTFQELVGMLEKREGMVESILDKSTPFEGARRLDHVRFAALCDAFQRHKKAISQYETLLKTRPDDSVLRLRMLHLLAQTDPEKAVAELKRLKKDEPSEGFVSIALNAISQADMPLEQRLDTTETLMKLIEIPDGESESSQDWNWISQLASRLEQNFTQGKQRYPGLFDLNFENDNYRPAGGDPREKYDALIRRRLEVYVELNRRGMAVPENASRMFSQLVRVKLIEAKLEGVTLISDTDLFELCKNTLLVMPPNPDYFWGATSAPVRSFVGGKLAWKDPENPAPQWTASGPVPWLVEYAARTKQQGLIDEQTLLIREKHSDGEVIASTLESLKRLYFCEPSKFVETIATVDDEVFKAQNQYLYKWVFVQRALAMRPEVNAGFDADALIFSELKKAPNDQLTNFAGYRFQEIAAEKGIAGAREFIEKIATSLIGEGKARDEMIQQHLPTRNNGYQPGTDPHRLTSFLTFLNQMGNLAAGAFAVAEFSRDAELSQDPNFRGSWSVFTNSMDVSTTEPFELLLKNSTLLNDLKDYETFPAAMFAGFSGRGHESMVVSMLSRLRDRFRGMDPDLKEKFLNLVEGETFGAKVLRSLLNEQADAELLNVFDAQVVAIQNLPKAKREELAQLGASLIRLRSLPTPVTEDQRRTLRWMAQESGEGAASKMDRLIAAKSIGELDKKPDEFYSFVQSEISDALFYDWEKAYRAFENVALLGNEAVRNGSVRWTQRKPFSVELLGSLVGNARPVEGFSFLNEAFHSEQLPDLFIDLPQIHSPVESALRNAGSDEDKIKVLAEFGKQLKAESPADRDTALVIPVFYQLIRSQPDSFIQKAMEWAEGADGIGLMPNIARDIGVALRMKKAGSSEFTEDEATLKRLSDVLGSSEIPRGLRFSLSEFVCEVTSATPDSLTQLAAKNLATAWGESELVAEYPAYDILRAVDRRFKKIGSEKWGASEWKAIDDELGDAIHQALVVGSPPVNNDNILVFGIQVQLRRGKPIQANEFYAKYEAEFNYPSSVFIEMVRYGQHEVAARLLRTQLEKVVSNSSGGQQFDPMLAAQVKPFLASLGDEQPWIQWIGEYVLTALSDPNNGQPIARGWASRTSRIQDSARKLANLEVPRESVKELMVSKFLGSHELEKIVRKPLEEVNRGRTVLDIGKSKNSSDTYLKTRLLAAQLVQEIGEGNGEHAIQSIRAYDDLSKNAQSRMDSYLFGIAETASSRFKSDEKVAGILIELWREIAERKSYSETSSSTESAVGWIIAAHFRGGKEAELDKFFYGLSYETRKAFTAVIKRGAPRMSETFLKSFSDLSVGAKRDVERKFSQLALPTLGIKNLGKSRTEQFLSAKTLEESKFQYYNFEAKVTELLKGAESLSERRKIYDHAITLVQRQEQSAKGWGSSAYTNGWLYSSEQLQEYCAAITSEPWDGISLVADVIWHNTPKDLEYSWENIYKFGAAFRPRWRKLVVQRTADEALPMLLDELRNSLRTTDESKWGSSAVFFPYFFDCCDNLGNPGEVRWMILAADKLLLKNKDDVLARELAMAGRFWFSTEKGAEDVAEKIPRLDEWIPHVTHTVESEQTSVLLKMSMIRCVLYKGEGVCSDSLRRNFCERAADLILADTPVNGWVMSLMIEDFSKLPRDAEWDRVAEKFAKGWIHKNRNNHIAKNKGVGFHPVDEPMLGILNLLLRRGDEDGVKKHLDEYGASIKEDPRVPAVMILNGKYDEAREWIMENFIAYNPNDFHVSRSKIDIHYDAELHTARTKFLATMEPGETQFFCAYYMAFPSDLAGDERLDPAVVPPRTRRMLTLAKQFKDIEFSNDKNRHHAEYLMTRLWQSAAVITPHLKGRFETIDAESLASNRSTIKGGRILYPAMGYTFGKLNQGDSAPFIELVTRVGSGPIEKNDYYRQHYLKQFNYVLLKFIDAKFPTAPQERITTMREASAAFLETIDCSSPGSEFGDQMRCQIVLAAMQDDQAGLAAWRAGLSEKEQVDLQTIFKKQRAISANYLAKLLNVTAPKPVSDEVRWKAVSALLSDPWFQKAWADAPNGLVLKPLLQRKLLTDSQIKEKGESLIKLWPRRGKMASELAEWYMSNQDPGTAIHFADIGAKSAGQPFVKRLMLHKVNCLVDLDEYDKAGELLDSIKEADLPNDLKNMRFKAAAKLKRNLDLEAK